MRFKEVKKLIIEQQSQDEDLFEVKMTGSNLEKLAKGIKGVMVGLEFEMIVPNVDMDDDSELEPDYDMDEPVRDIDEAVGFFDDGEYNSDGNLRRLRDAMQEAFWEWLSERLDEDWWNNGYEYFSEYLDREDPFDEDEAQEEATNQLQAEYGDNITPEEFQTMLDALVEEKRESYVQEQWDDQSSNFDDARQEYEEDHRDDYSEQDWLRSEGIRYASDVENTFGNVQWPYYTGGGDNEIDIKKVALDFMNSIGDKQIAVSQRYHGRYELWNGKEWINFGSDKPDFCFAIEPDGSLNADESTEAGLEFVSPPIPLDKLAGVMGSVKAWANNYGAYTGKVNKTSMHTNISLPNYSIKNLDYVKAALLLGDEHVLRQFDRIGNTYANPAIEKVRYLVKNKPEKAKELLDAMKSHLNATASKLLHSGVTDKFTSINTKDNRIEFRSPGGDYLTDMEDDPKKIVDTINRMVVVMDAALDPEKYKEEYQKKLYKMLTGQQSGREAKSGQKRELKKDDNDLLNIFSRYAAGELPKQALKSFVRQAQTQRKLDRGDMGNQQYWWRVSNPTHSDASIEVVAKNKNEAIELALGPDGYPSWANTRQSILAKPLRPYDESPVKAQVGEPQPVGQQFGAARGAPNYAVVRNSTGEVVHRFYADDRSEAIGQEYDFVRMQGWNQSEYSLQNEPQPVGRQSSNTAQTDYENRLGWPDQTGDANYEIVNRRDGRRQMVFIANTNQDALRKYEQWLEVAGFPQDTEDFGFREIAIPGSTLDLQRQRAAQAQQSTQQNQGNWGLWLANANRFARAPGQLDDNVLRRYPSREAAEEALAQAREQNPRVRTDIEVREIEPARTPVGDINLFPEIEPGQQAPRTLTTPGQGQEVFTGEWKVLDPEGNEIYRFSGVGNNQSDANRVAINWLRQNPRHLQGGVEVLPVMGPA